MAFLRNRLDELFFKGDLKDVNQVIMPINHIESIINFIVDLQNSKFTRSQVSLMKPAFIAYI